MAEVTAFRNNALPYPVYGVPWAVVFPFLDADGDLVSAATTPDAEVSKNGDTFADCTNESTEIATTSGMWYLLLTATEMTADIVTVIAKSATAGMKTTPIVLYPRKLVALRAATAAGGAAGSITLDASASAVDDHYNGCLVVGVLDTLTEARIITDYTGSTKVAAVTPNWNTTPDSDDTFTVYLTEGLQIVQSNLTEMLGTAVSTPATAGILDVNVKNIDNDAASASGTVTFPNATLASTTNITAGTIATVTTVTGLTAATVHADLDDIQARLPAALTANGNIKASLVEILTTALTETAGLLAGGFKKFFNIATPASTMDVLARVTLTDTVTTYTGNTVQTGDAYARIGAAGAGLTALGDARIANLDATISSRATPAQVNTEVLDVLNTDTFAEPGQEAPPATTTLVKKLGYLYKFLRNKKTQTATTLNVFADDASTVDQKATVSDDATTYTQGEIASGP